MQSVKCPGPDGFPAEFFKKFSLLLSPMLCSVFSESCRQGSLPPSFTEACIINLIANKGKDLTEFASYRPITLLNMGASYFIHTPHPQFTRTHSGQDRSICIAEPARDAPWVPCFLIWPLSRLPQHSVLARTYLASGEVAQSIGFHYMLTIFYFFISYLTASLPPTLSLLSQFGKFSGYKLNLNKSELFPINNNAQALDLANLLFKGELRYF